MKSFAGFEPAPASAPYQTFQAKSFFAYKKLKF